MDQKEHSEHVKRNEAQYAWRHSYAAETMQQEFDGYYRDPLFTRLSARGAEIDHILVWHEERYNAIVNC